MSEQRFAFDAINDRIKHIAHPVGVELGVHRGYFSQRMLALHPGLTLFMIDAWHPMAYEGKGDDAAGPESRANYQEKCDDNHAAAIEAVRQFDGRFRVIRKFSAEAVGFSIPVISISFSLTRRMIMRACGMIFNDGCRW